MTADAPKLRLHRLDRLYVDYPLYFVTACTHKRRPIIANNETHAAFVEFGERGPLHGAWIGRYVLMPDHIHLFVALDDQQISLPKWGKSLKNALSRVFRSQRLPAPHWQKTFFDHVLRSSEYYAEKWEYVRQNPLRAGLVTKVDDWPYAGEMFRLETD